MAHQYDDIDHVRIWNLLGERLPDLAMRLERLLPSGPAE